jgi:peptidoglycan/xylan/chitin deacetylase (PgdA/CDA1 family)
VAAESDVLVLTYHSVADAEGPTSIAPDTFAMQMRGLAECGYTALTLDQFIDWRRDPAPSPGRRVLISFDDGFADFATTAAPILQRHGFPSLMFLPVHRVGEHEDWIGDARRPLMGWDEVKALASDGVAFGSHTLTHPNLTRLSPADRLREIRLSGRLLAEALGRPTRSFAAPYGRVNKDVLADVAETYEAAFGVRLGIAAHDCLVMDVPRIEMHYFREEPRWRAFLEGKRGYFQTRKALRDVRETANRLMGKDFP